METTPGATESRSGAPPMAHVALAGADLVRALEDAYDLEVLERRLLAFVVHSEGLAAHGAWLLRRTPAGFELAAALRGLPPELTLREALRSPGLPTAAGEPGSPLIEVVDLDPPLETAWSRGTASAASVPPGPARPWQGVVGALPLRAGLRPYGLLVGAWADDEPAATRARDLALLQRLATGAAEVLERAGEARRRVRQAEAIREVARLAVSSVNLAEALRLAVRVAAHATGARGSALWLGAARDGPRLEATHGPAGRREGIARALEPLARQAIQSGRAAVVEADAAVPPLGGEAADVRAVTVIPFIAFGAPCGALAVYDRALPHPSASPSFDGADREFLDALADLVAGLADQARRFDQLRLGERREQEREAELRRSERLVAQGERAAEWMREARQGLASIAAFARRMHRALDASHPHRDYLEIVLREVESLERRCQEPGLPAPPEPPLRVENVNAALQEVLQESSERLVRRRVRLLKRMAPDLPALLIHPGGLRRTLRNVVGQALDRVSVGGRIRVETRRAPQHVVVEVSHDGARHPGEMLEELFAPFAERTPTQNEPGLALARRIVREHGGEVRLRSEGEWTSIVSLTLPIAENRDRRVARDRRGGRSDRRSSGAPA